MKSVLIISYLYHPKISPRAHRWHQIAKYLVQNGHNVTILTSGSRHLARKEMIDGIEVNRVGISLRSILLGIANKTESTRDAGSSMISRAIRITRHLWSMICWPDYLCLWILPATLRARRLQRRKRFDTVISVSWPFTSHVVGFGIKESKWIADIGDPFSFETNLPQNNHLLYQRLNDTIERRLLKRSDAVCVTTEEASSLYVRHWPEAQEKLHVIPHLASWEPTTPESSVSTHEKKIVFTGTINPGTRPPEFFLDCMEQLLAQDQRMKLEVFGDIHRCIDKFLILQRNYPDQVLLEPPLPPSELHPRLKNVSAMVNIGNRSSYQLPSKIVDYLVLGRPILNFADHGSDTSAAYLAQYAPSLTIQRMDGVDQAVSRIRQFLDNSPDLNSTAWKELINAHQIEAIGSAYEDLL